MPTVSSACTDPPVRVRCSAGTTTMVQSLGKPSTTVRVTCTPRSGQVSAAFSSDGNFVELTFSGNTVRVPRDDV
jgi:hypothetical protein